MEVKSGNKVKVNYKGTLENGEVFDQSKEPLEFVVDSGSLIKGFNEGVKGMKVGEKKKIEISPEEAYGPKRDDLKQEIPKEFFRGAELKEGNIVNLQTQDGRIIQATVEEIKDEAIVVDFNHPLAGKKLIFEIEVVDISE